MPTLEEIEKLQNAHPMAKAMNCSFIEPGVVFYQDVGMVLVQKTALDKMMNSMRGKPVVNTDHREINADDFRNGNFDGMVDGNDHAVWFDSSDAKYHCSFQVTTPETLTNIKNGFKVSCAYKVTKWGPGGIHNNVPYEREVLEGEYTHLAIVANPRYEGVRIYNSKGAKTMTLKWIQKLMGKDDKVLENSVDIESSKSILEVDGKDYTLDNAIEALKAQEAAKEAARLKALENKAPADDEVVDVPGLGKRTIKELKEAIALKNSQERLNAEEKEKKEKEDKEKADRENAAAAELKLKNDLEKDHKEKKHDEAAKENCAMCNERKNSLGRSHFERVQAAAQKAKSDELANDLPAHFDGFEEGRKRFGSDPAPAAKK